MHDIILGTKAFVVVNQLEGLKMNAISESAGTFTLYQKTTEKMTLHQKKLKKLLEKVEESKIWGRKPTIDFNRFWEEWSDDNRDQTYPTMDEYLKDYVPTQDKDSFILYYEKQGHPPIVMKDKTKCYLRKGCRCAENCTKCSSFFGLNETPRVEIKSVKLIATKQISKGTAITTYVGNLRPESKFIGVNMASNARDLCNCVNDHNKPNTTIKTMYSQQTKQNLPMWEIEFWLFATRKIKKGDALTWDLEIEKRWEIE